MTLTPSPQDKNIEWIKVKGAKTHNLKNIDVQIPRGKMTVISGLSGSGKSSLAFDTVFAEGQRRYVESLSAYARQFLDQMQKPDVDEISGLSPAISIDQKSRSNNPRSTVATITEIYDYLRVLYARVGRPHCLICGDQISKLSVDEIVDFITDKVEFLILDLEEKKACTRAPSGVDLDSVRLDIFSPVVRERKGEHYQMLYDLLGRGYSYVRVDGKMKSLREKVELSPKKKHTIEILVDQFQISEFAESDKSLQADLKSRLTEAVEKSLTESEMLVVGSFVSEEKSLEKVSEIPKDFLLSAKFACPKDGFSFGELEPRTFSFNSPVGACENCNGLGTESLFSKNPCKVCNGRRLKNEGLAVFLGKGKSKTTSIFDIKGVKKSIKTGLNIVDVTALTITEALDFFKNLKLDRREAQIAKPILREIIERITFMNDVGIDYITLDRRANTLSGGEAQRIRLASQLGSGLVGATYVLDEPTIGLHQRDNDRLIKTLLKMRDMGNTVIVVEHDEEVIYAADYLIDIGPEAGASGGEVVAMGWLSEMLQSSKGNEKSATMKYLRNEKVILLPEKRKTSKKGEIKINGANIHNIKNQNITLPLGKFVSITGVSGSGKSSFMHEVLYRNIDNFHKGQKSRKKRTAGIELVNCSEISGMENFARTVLINQSPIGRTPRSNPATYTGAFTFIRELYAATTEAKIRAYKPGRFSFNVPGGRCEACSGNGQVKVEMHFLPDVYVLCDICSGKRFAKETLEVTYKNKNISEVLEMSIQNAAKFFKDIPQISDRLNALENVGLGYLKLGQSATTLSGGEAQRVKIASELYRPQTEKTLFLLDEPTVGLHYDDVAKLNKILQLLVEKGNTVVVIEHNLDLIKISDYILDFGPDGGEKGGRVVAKGIPEEIANSDKSLTGKYLKKVLAKSKKKK